MPDLPSRLRTSAVRLAAALLLLTVPTVLHAQTTPSRPPILPGAPTLALLDGTVTDDTGALVPDAQITLSQIGATVERNRLADPEGKFRFADLEPGEYVITVSAANLGTVTSIGIQLASGETRTLPNLTLPVAPNHVDITVTITRHQLAEEELHAAEQQRLAGFPDFYTCFQWNAVHLDAGQKFSLALHATTDRMSFVGAGLIASGEQIQNTFPAYGHGFGGYARRYGAAYTDATAGKFIGSALLPSLFRQDPRYFYMGSHGNLKQRIRHAMLSAILARGDDGHLQPNYSHILGNASAGALSTLYHPQADTAAKLALDNALLGTLGEAAVNLSRELFLKHFLSGLPAAGTP